MFRLLVALLVLVTSANSARILCLFPTPAESHQNVFQPYWRKLSRKHQVVVFTPRPLRDETLTNLTEINWPISHNEMNKFKHLQGEHPSNLSLIGTETRQALIKHALSHHEITKLIGNQEQRFDLVVVEGLYQELYAFGQRFNCPIIVIAPNPATIPLQDAMGNPSHPVYNPDPILGFKPALNLLQRTHSVLYSMWIRIYHAFYYLPKCDEVVKEYFGKGVPSIYDMERKLDIMFVISNPIFHTVRPNFPSVIEINGMHIREKKMQLPTDLKSYLNAAIEGVVYVSLPNIKTSSLAQEKVSTIVQALSELPYRVLFNWEDEHFPNTTAENIMFIKRIPQQDIFGHGNVKVFITQGGLQSVEEAIYNHIPLIGIPLHGDQFNNMAQVLKYGMGKQMQYSTFSKEVLKQTIVEVITNPIYKENVKKIATLSMDKPMSSLKTAVWWTEYVIRHKGAKYLRSPAIDIPWYQYLLLDVLAIFISFLYVGYRFVVAVRFIHSNRVVENLVIRYKLKTS